MAQAASKKITLSSSRDIPFNKLILSQSNVRKIKAGVSIEELSQDIARRGARPDGPVIQGGTVVHTPFGGLVRPFGKFVLLHVFLPRDRLRPS